MTTYVLSFRPSLRALRLVVASLLVLELIVVLPFLLWGMPLAWCGLMGLAWFIVPGDRRWFIPGTLIFVVEWFLVGAVATWLWRALRGASRSRRG